MKSLNLFLVALMALTYTQNASALDEDDINKGVLGLIIEKQIKGNLPSNGPSNIEVQVVYVDTDHNLTDSGVSTSEFGFLIRFKKDDGKYENDVIVVDCGGLDSYSRNVFYIYDCKFSRDDQSSNDPYKYETQGEYLDLFEKLGFLGAYKGRINVETEVTTNFSLSLSSAMRPSGILYFVPYSEHPDLGGTYPLYDILSQLSTFTNNTGVYNRFAKVLEKAVSNEKQCHAERRSDEKKTDVCIPNDFKNLKRLLHDGVFRFTISYGSVDSTLSIAVRQYEKINEKK